MSQHLRYKLIPDPSSESLNYCHPSAVLNALSVARRDHSTDIVSRNAVITVDVGDVTLVSLLMSKLLPCARIYVVY